MSKERVPDGLEACAVWKESSLWYSNPTTAHTKRIGRTREGFRPRPTTLQQSLTSKPCAVRVRLLFMTPKKEDSNAEKNAPQTFAPNSEHFILSASQEAITFVAAGL